MHRRGAALPPDRRPLAQPCALCGAPPRTGDGGVTAHARPRPADEALASRACAPRWAEMRSARRKSGSGGGEPRGRYRGQAAAVLLPRSPEEVAAVVRLCAEARVGIVPYSGGTGRVGGAKLAEAGPMPVLLAFERMARIRDFDPATGLMVAEAGAICRCPGAGGDGGPCLSAVARLRGLGPDRRPARDQCRGSASCAMAAPATSASASRRCWRAARSSMASPGCARTMPATTSATC